MVRRFGLLISLSLRLWGLGTLAYLVYTQEGTMLVSRLPTQSNLKIPFLRDLVDGALTGVHGLVGFWNQIPMAPIYVAMALIVISLIITFQEVSRPEIPMTLFPRFMISIGTLVSCSTLYHRHLAARRSDILSDFRGISLLRTTDLKGKREAFLEAYTEAFTSTVRELAPRTNTSQLDAALADRLRVSTHRLDDLYFASYHPAELAERAKAMGSASAHGYLQDEAFRALNQTAEEILRLKQSILTMAQPGGAGGILWQILPYAVIGTILLGGAFAFYYYVCRDNLPEAITKTVEAQNVLRQQLVEHKETLAASIAELTGETVGIKAFVHGTLREEIKEMNAKVISAVNLLRTLWMNVEQQHTVKPEDLAELLRMLKILKTCVIENSAQIQAAQQTIELVKSIVDKLPPDLKLD